MKASRGRRFVVACLAAGTAVWTIHAKADAPRTVRFEVERQRGAEDCPDAVDLQKAIVAQLGYDPFRTEAAERISVVFARTRDGFKSTVVRAGHGAPLRREQTSRADQCSELANSTRLALAIAIDPQAYLRPAPPPPAPAPEPSPPAVAPATVAPATDRGPAVRVEPPATASPPSAPSSPTRWWLGVGALSALGAAPTATGGLVVHASVRKGTFSLGTEGRFDWPIARDYGVGTLESNFIVASLLPCAHLGVGAACLVGSAGALRAKSTGFEGSTSRTGFLALVGARAAVTWALGEKTALVAFADLQLAPTRNVLTIDDRPAWETPRVTGSLGLQFRVAP
ncbi:hypothetical protein LVJ94_51135 [Pendulispora rubella]|uniref:Outer membrane protein beta-barrel domain-containing protein n=1 Tax=Pendulispora rubella TaxID=2741070 RepID=A0ABZ2L3A3_9BACT